MTARTFDAVGVRSVLIENLGRGSVNVEPGPRQDMVEGTVSGDDELLQQARIRHDGDTLRIWFPDQVFRQHTAHIRIGVPAGTALTARTGSADVTATVPLGRSRLTTGSGDISLSEAVDLDLTSGSGGVSVGVLAGTAARVTSGSGDIVINEARCAVIAKSGSGDLLVRCLAAADLRASSGSGDISLPSTSGSVDLRTASGSLTVGIADGLPAWLDLSSTSGAVRVAMDACSAPAAGEPYVSIRGRTASGEIAVYRAS
ncbi:hypothetical protein GCM10022204_21080 [Microlunatus aurantiacus]|uniref:DUF4097 domain-containing protein n=1 Tax=Microlunatus aurantiacus TaxID=446786 RepID=A0ABP7DEQ6_9ACTN